jgi:hypothetical protein
VGTTWPRYAQVAQHAVGHVVGVQQAVGLGVVQAERLHGGVRRQPGELQREGPPVRVAGVGRLPAGQVVEGDAVGRDAGRRQAALGQGGPHLRLVGRLVQVRVLALDVEQDDSQPSLRSGGPAPRSSRYAAGHARWCVGWVEGVA